MEKYIKKRIMDETKYILSTKKTIREISSLFSVSKSTVHKDLHERLFYIDIDLYEQVTALFNEHIKTRHIKGGQSTKQKYLKK